MSDLLNKLRVLPSSADAADAYAKAARILQAAEAARTVSVVVGTQSISLTGPLKQEVVALLRQKAEALRKDALSALQEEEKQVP